MTPVASSSRSSRSPKPAPKSMPNASCSRSNQPPPRPSTARPRGLVVERGRQLGDQPRVAERRRRHEQAEADARRDRRHGSKRRPALELRVGPVGLVRQEVVVEPERVPAGAFDGQTGVAKVGPIGALDPESSPEPHARSNRRVTTGTGTPASRARTRSPGCRAARGSRPRRPTTAARTRCPCIGTGRPSGGPADSRPGRA